MSNHIDNASVTAPLAQGLWNPDADTRVNVEQDEDKARDRREASDRARVPLR